MLQTGNRKGNRIASDEILFSETITTDLTLVGVFDTQCLSVLFCEVAVATQDVDQFEISGRSNKSGSWHVLFNSAGDFISPLGILVGTSGDLTTISAGNNGFFILNIDGLFEIRIRAAAATTGAVVTLRGGMEG